MTVKRLDLWASSTSPTEPSYRAAGVPSGEQLKPNDYDWPLNRGDDQTNKNSNRLPDITYYGTDPQRMLATGLFGTDSATWGTFEDAANQLNTGLDIMDICTIYIDDERHVVVLTATTIEVWNSDGLAKIYPVATLASVTNALDTSGSQTWEAQTMACDGDDLYVVFSDTNAAPDDHVVQAFTPGSTFAVKSGWPTNGRALSSGNGTLFPDARIIVADSTNLAVLNSWTDITAANVHLIDVLTLATGAAVTYGAGNATNTSNKIQGIGLSSDGTNLYFTADDEVATAVISSAATSPGGKIADPTDCRSTTCTYVGGDLTVIGYGIDGTASVLDPVLQTMKSTTTTALQVIALGQNAGSVLNDTKYWEEMKGAWFDGFNLWLNTMPSGYFSGGSPYANMLIKVDVSRFSQFAGTANTYYIDEIMSGFYLLNPLIGYSSANVATTDYRPITFDGRDLWAVKSPQVNGTTVQRLPFSAIR